MGSIPGKSQSPKYVVKKSDKVSFGASKVVSIEFSASPNVRLTVLESFVVKVLAIKQDGSSQDVTQWSTLSVDDDDLVQLYPSGLMIANTTGLTTLRASFQGFEIETPVIATGDIDFIYFRWTMVSNSSDFTVDLPESLSGDTYSVMAQLVKSDHAVGIYLPDVIVGDRTEAQFRVITTSNLSIGDQIDFLILE